jgi:hypothetical protein
MGDENHSEQLPHRVRGAAQARPAPSVSPALSDELRQRMRAAVGAERARATGQGQPGQGQPGQGQPGQGQPGQERAESARPAIASAPAGNGVAAPAASGAVRPEPVSQPDPAVDPERKVRPAQNVTPERAAGPRPAAGAPAIGNPAAGLPARPRVGARRASARRRLLATSATAVALVILAAGCLGVAVARYLASWPAHGHTVSPAVERAEAASRRLAATWVTQQVSHAAAVACDPQMCAALTAAGFPSRNVRMLGQTATYPLTSAVVVVTQAVRDLFGSSLSFSIAPAVLATFGSADASITVRVIAPHGAAAYQAQLLADLASRKATGADLVQTSGITVSDEAKEQLVTGQPDSRLLVVIASLASRQPVDILDFENIGPGADPAIPLRFMDLAESDPAARTAGPAYLRALRASLGAMSARFRPTSIRTGVLHGQAVLRIEFTAPTPFGLLGPQ